MNQNNKYSNENVTVLKVKTEGKFKTVGLIFHGEDLQGYQLNNIKCHTNIELASHKMIL